MPHLEGALSFVTGSGPWARVQGRHLRAVGEQRVSVRIALDPQSGLIIDAHFGQALWIRCGWYPSHRLCRGSEREYPVGQFVHRCWARMLPTRVFDLNRRPV